MKIVFKDAFGLFKGVVLFLLLGAGIGAFIYEFVPTDLLANFAGADNLWAVPLAAVVGIPMYIRTETMIPIASILISKGVAPGVMIALILGGAGASTGSIFVKFHLKKENGYRLCPLYFRRSHDYELCIQPCTIISKGGLYHVA